jgi:hypothetical protein
MPASTFPSGFTNGVVIRGLPVAIAQPGKVYFLNNSSILAPGGIAGSDNGPGTWKQPYKTLAGALANTDVANFSPGRNDIIMVMPGHAETISSATALAINVKGIMVMGLGNGALRPTFTLDTATTATIKVTAASVSIVNCLFIANFAAIAACITLTNAPNFYMGNCEFRDTSSILNFVNPIVTNTTSNNSDGLYVENCQMYGMGATTNTCFVNALGTNDRWTLKGNYVAHAAVTGGGFMQTASGKNITNAIIDNNTAILTGATSLVTGTFIIAGGTANTGIISNNFCRSLDDTAQLLVTASSGWSYKNNYYEGTADTSGMLLPAVGT